MKKKRLYNKVNKEELKQRSLESNEVRTTLSFYRYAKITDVQAFRDQLFAEWSELGVFGRTYVAAEGINAQLSLPTPNLDAFREQLYAFPFLDNTRLNIAVDDDGKSFYVLKIKIRNKILADGLSDDTFDVTNKGVHLNAEKFNEITADPNTVLVDMRNHYESEVGHFDTAITPDVETFRDSLPIIEEMLEEDKDKNIVMYCTGGIRCEKASAYYKHKGFKNVFQLEGGIIEYARQVEEQGLENKFKGKNFVFDERMGERISEEVISKCHQCGVASDNHVNCANDGCHILFLQCENCVATYENCCSEKCKGFIQLPEEERIELRKTMIFNGTKFGKGRYKAARGGGLEME
ncbi:MAG: UPF0176 protein [Polaribacter sp.]|jgi:UPF0176 protein